jgi:hypothetical protein
VCVYGINMFLLLYILYIDRSIRKGVSIDINKDRTGMWLSFAHGLADSSFMFVCVNEKVFSCVRRKEGWHQCYPSFRVP